MKPYLWHFRVLFNSKCFVYFTISLFFVFTLWWNEAQSFQLAFIFTLVTRPGNGTIADMKPYYFKVSHIFCRLCLNFRSFLLEDYHFRFCSFQFLLVKLSICFLILWLLSKSIYYGNKMHHPKTSSDILPNTSKSKVYSTPSSCQSVKWPISKGLCSTHVVPVVRTVLQK